MLSLVQCIQSSLLDFAVGILAGDLVHTCGYVLCFSINSPGYCTVALVGKLSNVVVLCIQSLGIYGLRVSVP